MTNIQSQNLDSGESKAQIAERFHRNYDMRNVTVTRPKPQVNPFDQRYRKRVAVYCRVSTDHISQTPSLLTQRKYYISFVRKRKDLHMRALYWDRGISATSVQKREGLIRLLRDAQKGYFDIIIVKNLSRLSRNLMDCMRIIYMLRQLPNPVGILFEEENLFTLDKNADFTLQILAMLAQEESHKKSEAVLGSLRKRYEMGLYIKFDILGFDRAGTNQLIINNEEAQTLQLIFNMFLAGCDADLIAEVLNMLGRKKHTHKYVDGSGVKGGLVNWTPNSVMGVLKNEKCCGDVDARKTVTLDYLTHKSVPNVNIEPRFYARNHHDAIVKPANYYLAQRLIVANRRGWKHGIQEMTVLNNGFVSTVPNWYGFVAEDYNRACLRAYGIKETELEEIENRIINKDREIMQQSNIEEVADVPEKIEVDSDDYENFPEENVPDIKEDKYAGESFAKHVKELRYQLRKEKNMTALEICRAEFFSLTDKACITLDQHGMSFNKFSFKRLNESEATPITNIKILYNPLEQVLVVRKTREAGPSTLNWAKSKNGKYEMKRCCSKGLSTSIYKNMCWNTNYKYRIVGRAFEYKGETMLMFFLDSPTEIVPAKIYRQKEKLSSSPKRRKHKFQDGALSDDIVLPEIEELKISKPSEEDILDIKSSVIYFDRKTMKDERDLTLEDLGNERYSADRITHMLKQGITPQEGWNYLKGMAEIDKNGFKIFPESWADSFGDQIFNSRDDKLEAILEKTESFDDGTPYGWTAGIQLPTMEQVNEEIEQLKKSANP